MRIEIPPVDAELLAELSSEAELSRARWVRGAIRAAASDAEIATRVRDAAPASEHGGQRPGAGRPPQSTTDQTEHAQADAGLAARRSHQSTPDDDDADERPHDGTPDTTEERP